MSDARILPSADVDARASVGPGTVVWHLAQVREGAEIGEGCIIGRGAYIDAGVRVGPRSKIQNHALVYAPAELGAGVFVGPGAMLTNDPNPRAVTPDGALKTGDDWDRVGAVIGDGASVGAGAIVLGGISVGAWALIAAGSVVTRDVPAYALVVGGPARRVGWVGRAGFRLEEDDDGAWRCPRTGARYVERAGDLEEAP